MSAYKFQPSCEVCGKKGAVRCDDHPKRKQFRAPQPTRNVSCQKCGATSNIRKTYKLEPRNFRPVFQVLCVPCQKRTGFVPVDHARVAMAGTWLSRSPVGRKDAA